VIDASRTFFTTPGVWEKAARRAKEGPYAVALRHDA
jgi:hypothetical protein